MPKKQAIFQKNINSKIAPGITAAQKPHGLGISRRYTVTSKKEKGIRSSLSLFLFGRPMIKRDDFQVEINRRRALALAAYLALSQGPQNRDTLATLLWPENEQVAARTSLGTCLTQLRKLFGFEFLLNGREHVSIHPDLKLRVDVKQFQELITGRKEHHHPEQGLCPDCAISWAQAIELYQGDFMSGFVIPDNDPFENWKRNQAEDLHQNLIKTLRKLVYFHHSRKEFEPGIHYARRWLREDPLDEKAHFHLMRLYADSGQPTAALRQYEACVHILKKELDVGPQEAMVELHAEIKKRRPAPPVMPVKSWPLSEENPPVQPEPCIGREKEIKEINRLLADPHCRLLTLVGPGGVGKTQLAHKIYSDGKRPFRDGIFFVPLGHLNKAEFIFEAIAYRLDLTFFSEIDRHAQVLRFLNGKQLLLILDNFEHLPDGASLVTDILRRTAGVKILVTSQQRLNLKEEWAVEIQGLDYPHEESPSQLEQYSAVQLYIESAKRVRPGFALQEEDRAAVSRICRSAQGLPLAIELAAGWLQMLSCREIAKEMEKNLGFLNSPWRDIPERHRSLEAVFERSWGFLTPDEQLTMKKLSIFRGGFTRQAAEAVTGASLPVLLSLIHKSFLKHQQSEYCEMLDLLRKFVRNRVQFSPEETEDIHSRHAVYFGNWLQKKEPALQDGRQKQTIMEMTAEIQNIHKGWQWAVFNKRMDVIEQYLEGLFYFYKLKGWFYQGSKSMQSALDELNDDTPVLKKAEVLKGKILSKLGELNIFWGQPDKARFLLLESVSILNKMDLKIELGRALNQLGVASAYLGQADEAKTYLIQALNIFEQEQNSSEIAISNKFLGVVFSARGEYETAKKMLEKALATFRARHDQFNIAFVLEKLGLINEQAGRFSEAIRWHRECLDLYSEFNEEAGKANCLNNLGFAYFGNKEYEEAEDCFRKAVKRTIMIQNLPILQEGLIGLAYIWENKKEKIKALEIIAFMQHATPIIAEVQKRAGRLAEKLRKQFDELAFDALMEESKDRSLEYFTDQFKQGLI